MLEHWQTDWNQDLGWVLVAAGGLWGAALGLGFARPNFLGGYDDFRRRLLRLGHVACMALGAANVFWSVAVTDGPLASAGGIAWAVGGVCMPAVCALTAWRPSYRHAFPLPVAAVLAGAVMGVLA